MKTNKKLMISILIIPLLLSLQGCLDIYLTTEIHPNGQIDQTIVFEGDSTSILESYIPAVHNNTWDSEWIKVDDDKHKLILSKSFKNDKEFNNDMNPADSLPGVRVEAKLKKKFRWFFTYIDFKETLLPSNPFSSIDWRDYLSNEEMELIVMDEDERKSDPRFDDDLYEKGEKKFEEYIYRSGYEDFFLMFVKAVSLTPSSNIDKELLENKKEEIYQYAYNETDFSDSEDIIKAFEAILGKENVQQVYMSQQELFIFFNIKLAFFNECMDDNYYFSIKMPGLLVETNSKKIESSLLSWEVDFFDFYFQGLEMQAQSRIVNKWAFILAGTVILFLFFGISWNIFRRKE